MNTGLTLRTAHIRNGVATVRAGATLLFESDPLAEERETELKARALLETLAEAPAAARRGPPGARPPPRRPALAAPRPGDGLRVLLVDHQDSFVHTLAGYFREQGAEVLTLRAGLPLTALDEYAPGPGGAVAGAGPPGRLRLRAAAGQLDLRGLPAFGVCLGLQAMVEHAGGELGLLSRARARQARHRSGGPGRRGRAAGGLPGRVHRRPLPLAARGARAGQGRVRGDGGDARTGGDGDRGSAAGRWAVQFHPESILTAAGSVGHQVIANVLRLCRSRRGDQVSAARGPHHGG